MPSGASLPTKRKHTRAALATMFADIPRKRRAAFWDRVSKLIREQLEENVVTDTKFDEKGRILRFGTTPRDRAGITKATVETLNLLADISKKAVEHDTMVDRLVAGLTGSDAQPQIHIHLAPQPAISDPAPEPLNAVDSDEPSSDTSQLPPDPGLPGTPD